MIANSPVRQNSPLNMHGLDVVPYQPPWKALSEFALYANLENDVINQHNPAFRRLVNQVSLRYFSNSFDSLVYSIKISIFFCTDARIRSECNETGKS